MTKPRHITVANELREHDQMPLAQDGLTRRSLMSGLVVALQFLLPGLAKANPGSAQNVHTSVKELSGAARADLSVIRADPLRGGLFGFDPSDRRDDVAADPRSAMFVAPEGEDGTNGAFFRQHDLIIHVKWFGVTGDGVTDDSLPFQDAIDYVARQGGGVLVYENTPLIGDLVVQTDFVDIVGATRNSQLIVKSGTTGITFNAKWIGLQKTHFVSQGTQNDGNGTNAVKFFRGASSSAHINIQDLYIDGFSGVGVSVTNSVHFSGSFATIRNCGRGLAHLPEGDTDAAFGTTFNLSNFYFSSCTIGLYTEDLKDAFLLGCTQEFCDIGIEAVRSSITDFHGYREGNKIQGVRSIDSEFRILFPRIKPGQGSSQSQNEQESIWTLGVMDASRRGYTSLEDNVFTGKGFGLLSRFGVDPKVIKAIGDTENVGVSYGDSAIAMIRGDNLLKPEHWVSHTTREFKGWDVSAGGYRIASGSLTSACGMKQEVELLASNQYVIDFHASLVLGSAISQVKVGRDTVNPGSLFTVPVDGKYVVKAFGIQSSGGFKSIVHVFNMYQVEAKREHVFDAADFFSRDKDGRGKIFMSEPPTSGSWAVGETVVNNLEITDQWDKWRCVVAGSPGIWKGYGGKGP